MERLRESLAKLEKKEELLRDTLIAAQKFSSEIKVNSHKEAELITKDAEMKSEEIVKHAVIRQMAISEEIKNLQFKRKEIESDIIHLLNSLKELIETYHKQDEEFDKIEYLGNKRTRQGVTGRQGEMRKKIEIALQDSFPLLPSAYPHSSPCFPQ